MIAGNLNTTNILLGIMAGVSVLQALVLIGAVIIGYRLYRQAMQTIREIEERRVAPLTAKVDAMMTKVDGIIADARNVMARVSDRTDRVDSAIDQTIHRVDATAERVRASIAARLNRIAGLAYSAKSAFGSLFNGRTAA
jgi:hypothetical protein